MTNRPLVSIIMPAYNSSAFIRQTIDSALHQTWGTFELLITDDGSTDDTVAIIEEISSRDSRVRLIGASPHAGPAVARNLALTHARGEFVALLDSDDVWKEPYLEEQVGLLMRHHHIGIVTANAINLGGPFDGQTIWPETEGTVELAPGDLVARENAVCIMAVFRRHIVDRIGVFDQRFTANEDYEFWLRAVDAGFVVLQNLAPLGFYRRRPNSVSADDIRMLKGIIAVLEQATHLRGALSGERPVLDEKLAQFRQELIRAEMRWSLSQHDPAKAADNLRRLSELTGGRSLAVAARVGVAWPQLLDWAYSLRCALRSRPV